MLNKGRYSLVFLGFGVVKMSVDLLIKNLDNFSTVLTLKIISEAIAAGDK